MASKESEEIAQKVIGYLCEDNKPELDKLLAKTGVIFLSPEHLSPLVSQMENHRQALVEN